jgi:MFS transporter, MHS family, shikimate and dehydroshikimate transport protein
VFGLFSARLTESQFLSWGWRVPFLLSIAMVAVGLFIRLKIAETPAFVRVQEAARQEARPIVVAIRQYRRNMLLAMGMRVAE